MRKKFAGNLLLLIFANVLVKPFWIFGIDRVVQNRAAPGEYGTYLALMNFSFLFGIMLDFGLNNFNNRAIARHPSRLATYLPNLMVLKVSLSLVYFAVALLGAMLTGYSGLQIRMLMALALNQVLLSYILYLRSNLTALHLFRIDSFISVLDRFLAIIFCGVLLYLPSFASAHFDIHYFIFSQTAALGITAIVAFISLKGRQRLEYKLWTWRYVRSILVKSAPFAMLGLLMTIYYRIDAIMLERMYSAIETDIYAKAYRLLDAVNQFGYLFGVPLLPLFANMIRKRQDIQELLSFSAVLMFVFSTAVAILCGFYADEIMRLLYPASSAYTASIFRLLMISFIPISSVYIFGTLLTAQGTMSILNMIAVGGIIVNVALNIALIPRYGALGTTVATLATQMVVAVLHIWVVTTLFKVNWRRGLILRMVLFVVAGIGVSLACLYIPAGWMLRLAVNGALLGGLVLVLQLVPLRLVSLLRGEAGP
ncbi:MAG: polysaccharide biosynthesis C-terminal domain-containing protein [Bacteroidetes bacterium]|nr:polysaccharide biosynthesis C-terminal domain-containing protein [Bacteroidota bacterium]